MKKSKIIVPALGLLLLSTAASVSGTVAWFTASASANVQISSFAVKNANGSLATTLVQGVGTKLNGTAIVIAPDSGSDTHVLTDGSFDHINKIAYAHNPNTGASDTTHCISKGTLAAAQADETKWQAGVIGTEHYFNAVQWDITFTYTFGSDSSRVNLYFDAATYNSSAGTGSEVQRTSASTGTLETYKGFRIAFICGSEKFVWADNQTEANCHYIKAGASEGTTQQGEYTIDSDLIASDTDTCLANDSATSYGTELNYLGNFQKDQPSDTTASLTVTCVAWYEGTDVNVVDAATLDTVTAIMGFFTRTHTNS